MQAYDEDASSVIESDQSEEDSIDEISIPEEEWEKEEEELDQRLASAGSIVNNSILLNEKYEEAIEQIESLLQEGQFSKANSLCKSLLEGELKYRSENAKFWMLYAETEKKVGSIDSVIAVYDRGCKTIKDPHDLLELSLEMRSYVEDVVAEEEAVGEIDFPLSQQGANREKAHIAEAMFNLMRQHEHRSVSGNDLSVGTPIRPTGKRKRHELSYKGINIENEIDSTKIILTPIKASPSQQRKHKCDFILSPVRKSTRLMRNQRQDIVSDKLIKTTYAYTNNEYIQNKAVDA